MTLNIFTLNCCVSPSSGPRLLRVETGHLPGATSLTAASASAEQELIAEVSFFVGFRSVAAGFLSELPELPGNPETLRVFSKYLKMGRNPHKVKDDSIPSPINFQVRWLVGPQGGEGL